METTPQMERLRERASLVKPITCLDDIEFLYCEGMRLTAQAHIRKEGLNHRGFAHGGWLFALCDTCSGALVFSRGYDCVTQSATINYLSGGRLGDTVHVEVTCVHWGRSSAVNEVRLTDDNGRLLVLATLTMFLMG